MDDLISRQAAIDAIKKNTFRLTVAEEQNAEGHVAWSADAVYSDVIEGELLELPSAQPEYYDYSDIDYVWNYYAEEQDINLTDGAKQLKDAMWVGYRKGKQAAQPEIIHCKECKYGVQDEDKRWYCRGLGCQVGEADGSGFCADAERRTDDSISD